MNLEDDGNYLHLSPYNFKDTSFRFKISFCKCFQFHFSYISIELDQDEERASMGFGSADDYYSDAFDYYDDARAGTIIFTTLDILIAVKIV